VTAFQNSKKSFADLAVGERTKFASVTLPLAVLCPGIGKGRGRGYQSSEYG